MSFALNKLDQLPVSTNYSKMSQTTFKTDTAISWLCLGLGLYVSLLKPIIKKYLMSCRFAADTCYLKTFLSNFICARYLSIVFSTIMTQNNGLNSLVWRN